MTMQSMIGQQRWIAQALRPKLENETDEAGLIVDDWVVVLPAVEGRLVANSAHNQAMWASKGVVADYTFITFETRIQVGWVLDVVPKRLVPDTLPDRRRFMVQTLGDRKMGMGTLSSFCRYQLQETITTVTDKKDTT